MNDAKCEIWNGKYNNTDNIEAEKDDAHTHTYTRAISLTTCTFRVSHRARDTHANEWMHERLNECVNEQVRNANRGCLTTTKDGAHTHTHNAQSNFVQYTK